MGPQGALDARTARSGWPAVSMRRSLPVGYAEWRPVMQDTTLVHDGRTAPTPIGVFGRLRRDAAALFRLLLVWQDRERQRRHLREMNDRLFKDIGLSHADVAHEAAKPFWLD